MPELYTNVDARRPVQSEARRNEINGPIVGLIDEANRAGINPLRDFTAVMLGLIVFIAVGYFAIIAFSGV